MKGRPMPPSLVRVSVMFRLDEHRVPQITVPHGARVELSIEPPREPTDGLPAQPGRVCLSGTHAGLAALATWLLALAENATVLDHQHFDGEGTEGFLHPETGWELLVERTDKRRPGGAGAG